MNSALTYSETKRWRLSNSCGERTRPWPRPFTHNVTAFTVALLVEGVERLPSEMGVAGDACETLHVEHLLHGDTAAAVADHVVATAGAAS